MDFQPSTDLCQIDPHLPHVVQPVPGRPAPPLLLRGLHLLLLPSLPEGLDGKRKEETLAAKKEFPFLQQHLDMVLVGHLPLVVEARLLQLPLPPRSVVMQ